MTERHYDVVVLGRSIGALAAAALLARRDFTVLVLGQSQRPASYEFEKRSLRRRAFTLLAGASPVFRRLVVELAQSQTWKRRIEPASPLVQFLAPRRRLEVPANPTLFGRELDRELSDVRRLVDNLSAVVAAVGSAADEAFERDAVWPPGTFWERRETGRYAAMLPNARAEPGADLLAEFPRGHFFRRVVQATAGFATHLSTLPPPFAVARLHDAYTRGLLRLPGGEAELEAFLVDRIAAHGGLCLLGERAARLHVARGGAAGVYLDGGDRPIGCGFVLTDGDGESVAALAGGEGIHKRAQREWPRISSSVGRFVTSIVLRGDALPDPLGTEAFILPDERAAQDLAAAPVPWPRPVVHLERGEAAPGEALLVAEILLPDRGALSPLVAREAVLEVLGSELPFLGRHVLAVDSPHDGLPAWIYDGGRRRSVERAALRGGSRKPEPMVRQHEIDPPGYLGLSGEPIRGPIERTLLVGPTVLPALGQEGQLLAAWGAARLVTRSNRRRERMRREMWSKVEIG